jgi:hypothetical protein
MAGYSGTPLVKKLGIGEGFKVLLINAPQDYRALVAPLPAAVSFTAAAKPSTDMVHAFSTERRELARILAGLRKRLPPDAPVWVSTDITEDIIREVALPMGFVDVKVCAVTDVWSGLKLVVRKELRGKAGTGGTRTQSLRC